MNNSNLTNLVKAYQGKNGWPSSLAKKFKISTEEVLNHLDNAGILHKGSRNLSRAVLGFEHIKLSISDEALARRYRDGASTFELAKEFGVGRGTIDRRITKCGIQLRNNTDANRLMNSRRTSEQHALWTKAAHDAVRGTRRSYKTVRKQALTIQQKALTSKPRSKHERHFLKLSQKLGLDLIPQYAFKTQNLDFRITGTTIAVEMSCVINAKGWCTPPKRKIINKKIKRLGNAGWTLVWIWADELISERCIKKIIRLRDIFRKNPSSLCEQYVMLSNGNPTTMGCDNFKYRPCVLRAYDRHRIRTLNHAIT
jgi:hypothetical protein